MNPSQAAAKEALIVTGYRADAGRVVITRLPMNGAPSPNVVLNVRGDAGGDPLKSPAPSTDSRSGSDRDVTHTRDHANEVRFSSPIFSSTSSVNRYQGHDEYDAHGPLASPAASAVGSVDNYTRSADANSDVDDGAYGRLTSPALSADQPISSYADNDAYGPHGRFASPALSPGQCIDNYVGDDDLYSPHGRLASPALNTDHHIDNYAGDDMHDSHGRFASPALSAHQYIDNYAEDDMYDPHGRFASPALSADPFADPAVYGPRRRFASPALGGPHSVNNYTNGSVYNSQVRFSSPALGGPRSVEGGGDGGSPFARRERLTSPPLIAFSPQEFSYTGDGDRTPTRNAWEAGDSPRSLEVCRPACRM